MYLFQVKILYYLSLLVRFSLATSDFKEILLDIKTVGFQLKRPLCVCVSVCKCDQEFIS